MNYLYNVVHKIFSAHGGTRTHTRNTPHHPLKMTCLPLHHMRKSGAPREF